MSRFPVIYLRLFVLLAALTLCIDSAFSAPSPKDDKHDKHDKDDDEKKSIIRVKPHESIQDAIDKAKKGTRIEVYGTHAEQLEITKDDITLIGKNAILEPPRKYKKNKCTGLSKEFTPTGNGGADTNAGICIYGSVQLNDAYQQFEGHKKVTRVLSPVKNIDISGFTIRGFTGQNIAVYGGSHVTIAHNTLARGDRYGLLTAGSSGTTARSNSVVGASPVSLNNAAIAMCMDDIAPALFAHNDVSDYFIGLCTETKGGVNRENSVHGCCLGHVIDPGVKGAMSIDNHFFDHNDKCPVGAAAGISLLGSIDAVVKGNRIDGIVTGDGQAAGLFMGDFGGVATGNTVTKNKFGVNTFDIFVDSDGANRVSNNFCDVASKNLTSGEIVSAPEFCK